MAMTVAAMADAALRPLRDGLGTRPTSSSSAGTTSRSSGPYYKTRDMLRFLRKALTGERVEEKYDTFNVRGFRLSRGAPQPPPKILVAALRSGMLAWPARRATARSSTGSRPTTSRRWRPTCTRRADKEIVARIFVDPDRRQGAGPTPRARRACAAYLNVPVYAAFHDWLGRRELLSRCGRRGAPATARRRSS
jgi:alkanesulfonate monooxygenase SsuD/methylene tetrahydromethanopterin reductase-like flavin-dependent oxidoreductase (luciferase family)